MDWLNAPEYWLSRLILERGIAGVYVLAFVAAARQFRALIGEHGMLPVPRYLAARSFAQSRASSRSTIPIDSSRRSPGRARRCRRRWPAGLADVVPLWASMLAVALLWALYLSIVNVGQAWYWFGWESLLLEAGFLAIFLGNDRGAPPVLGSGWRGCCCSGSSSAPG